MNQRVLLSTAAINLFLAVALGAFGAHGLKNVAGPLLIETWKTGVMYHLVHGLALLALAPQGPPRSVFLSFLVGIIFFSGNCYLYVLTQAKFFALLVPVGGVSFLIGWAILAAHALKKK